MKVIKVPLSVNGLKELKNKINQLQSNLKNANDEIINDMVHTAEIEIAKNYASSLYTDGNEDSEPFKTKDGNTYKVGMEGTQVLYREFGTGTEGLNNPHPIKNKFNLKGYNTGRTIRDAKIYTSVSTGILLGEKYWTYKDKSGQKVYTQGIPAGKEVFNASRTLRNKIDSILKKRVSDALSKL